MTRVTRLTALLFAAAWLAGHGLAAAQATRYARDPKQPVNEEYTSKIREYTTEPFFSSPLVDYLPASRTVPTPKAVLGDVAGAPGRLPYSAQVHEYMRLLEKASPRVKVFPIGTSEEGREMIAVAVADAAVIATYDENRARLARLADPRTIRLDDAEADRLVAASTPVYYITGALHAGETGAPTALMELAYRLAVDESPYIRNIRRSVITLITPVVEVDGRDRQVDVYNWHLAHPGSTWPPVVYWGKYVVHDNNRDGIGLTLALTRNVLGVFVGHKAQVLHDLHESVPYLYDNTVGDGPYNAWIDPLLADEWQMLGWHNMGELTRLGMPGVFAHGTFDTWTPGYLMFIAALRNGTSRLYETFGNGGADTVERTLEPEDYARTWYRQNPPLPRARWSQRNNNNYEQTGLLTALSYYAENAKPFLKNFYLKAKRSVLKPGTEGPAAYVFPAGEARPGLQAELLRLLRQHGCEVSRADAAFSVEVPVATKPRESDGAAPAQPTAGAAGGTEPRRSTERKNRPREFPAGTYVLRLDQPYSRVADALLDYQYWSPKDPQKDPYDDTGWTLGELYGVEVVRVTDVKVLDVPVQRIDGPITSVGAVEGTGEVAIVNHDADPHLFALRYRLPGATFEVAEEPFEAAGRKFNRGSFVIRGVAADEVSRATGDLGLRAYAGPAPGVKSHPVKLPRIGYVHSWLATQDEGWWRLELDRLKIPYEYISTQDVARDASLGAKYDVILFPPVGLPAQAVVAGLPTWGNPLPWKTTPDTPNLGRIDETDDIRPGLGWSGLANLEAFVRGGGVLVTTDDTSDLAVTFGLAPGVAIARSEKLKAPGTVVRSIVVDEASPIAYGYDGPLAVYTSNGPIFTLASTVGGRHPRNANDEKDRPTGRGTSDDRDQPQGRPPARDVPDRPKAEPWQALPPTDDQLRNPIYVIPPAQRPRVVLRYADAPQLLVSGLLDGAGEIARHAAVVDVPLEKGHVVLFSPNPMWRGQTKASYSLVFNTILNFDRLDTGRRLDER